MKISEAKKLQNRMDRLEKDMKSMMDKFDDKYFANLANDTLETSDTKSIWLDIRTVCIVGFASVVLLNILQIMMGG